MASTLLFCRHQEIFQKKLIDGIIGLLTWLIIAVLCAIWYHVHNLRNVKNPHGGVLLIVKLQASACNFIKSNTPPWVFFTVFKLYEWYQIAKRTTFGYIFHRFILFKAGQVIVVIPQKFVFLFRKAYHIIIILLLSF